MKNRLKTPIGFDSELDRATFSMGLEECDLSSIVQPEIVRVDAPTFSDLLISKHHLQRWNSPESNQLGLFDPGQRVCYVIDETELYHQVL
ncbi:MAG: hypothetical protein JNL67_04055 [Planctomycetaceae bacterium]|nr:hypothetical protein [Planctomycetaceae bacterium]